ncbi:unnamed protein product [Eruca vesicaria subsp. sativa]|uniref:SPX domain-containing protein n=1 Tax=Eruca vesicaria subsp. sativa TaxID=29727 RepID=A0ABC8IT70_ERUVS|nr:unnamed protein product [Eruca vesicaria subsp. sativa]
MKFGKSLSNQIEQTLPEWRDKFLSYKDLKKRLKLIASSKSGDRPAKRLRLLDSSSSSFASSGDIMSKEEMSFVQLLEDELEKFNNFFVEKEEEYIIRLKELRDRIDDSKERKEIVDLHGEMVLLANYSALNYTGLVKILKKYDKRTGDLMRLPYIQKVLQQPFYTTDLLYKLIKESEAMLDRCFFHETPSEEDGTEHKFMESLHMKSTVAALRVLKEIRSKSSTVSVFSLPPLQLNGVDETWKKIPLMEQEAK